jgi:hypothetical protein
MKHPVYLKLCYSMSRTKELRDVGNKQSVTFYWLFGLLFYTEMGTVHRNAGEILRTKLADDLLDTYASCSCLFWHTILL